MKLLDTFICMLVGAIVTFIVLGALGTSEERHLKVVNEGLVKDFQTCSLALEESSTTSQSCASSLKKSVDLTQDVIETANLCMDILWTITPEDLEKIHAIPRPTALPSILPPDADPVAL